MKNKKEIKIGLIVLLGLLVGILGVNYLRGNNPFVKSTSYYGLYENSSGLSTSNVVTVNGVKVGIVNEVSLKPRHERSVLVKFTITEKGLELPHGTVARIISADILGSKELSLILGNEETNHAVHDTLPTSTEMGLQEAVNEQIAPLKFKSEQLISSIDSAVMIVRSIFDEQTRGNIAESFESLNNSFRNFERTSFQLDKLVSSEKDKLARIITNVESISTSWAENGEEISNIVKNFSSVSDSLASANISGTINELRYTMESVSAITSKIESGEGSVGLLLNDDALYDRLSSASDQLDALLEDFRLHPQRYAHFSVFGRKERTLKLSRRELKQLNEHLNMGVDSLP